jgi:hypothetical protein
MSRSLSNNLPGSRDETWGPEKDGFLSLQHVFKDQPHSLNTLFGTLLLANGDLLIATNYEEEGNRQFLIAKVNTLGELVRSFGNEGFILDRFEQGASAFSGEMAQGKDGRIYMFGASGFTETKLDPEIAILCIDEAGRRVNEFGIDGQITVENITDERVFYGERRFIRVLEDGSLLIGTNGATGSARIETAYLMKFDAKGDPVTSFGINGVVDIKLSKTQATTYLTGGCILDDGRMLVAGYTRPDGSTKSGLLAMLDPSGSLHQMFGDSATPGMRLITKPRFDIEFNAVTERESGKYMAAGNVTGSLPQNTQGLVVAFDAHGKNDTDFNNGSLLESSLKPGFPTSWLDILAQGQHIYVAGGESGHYLSLIGLDGKPNPLFGEAGIVEEIQNAFATTLLLAYSTDRLLFASNSIGPGQRLGNFYRYYRA